MGKLDEFIQYLETQVKNHSIYVFSAQGQGYPTITETWIRKMETTPRNAQRAIDHWHKECALGYEKVLKAFDCSGLGMYWLCDKFGYPDMTADSMMKKLCDKITRSQLKRGCWVFKVDATGKATHVGYVVDSKLNVIECKGRDDGVVKRPLSAASWNAYGLPACFAEDIENQWIATRPLKKTTPTMKGEDVKELQRHLIERGFSCGSWGVDGSYGKATEAAVLAFQKAYWPDNPVEWDGKAGRRTLTALGAICIW